MLLRRYFYAENAKNAGVLLFVLCLNEEQQKHCVVRDLNINTYKDKDCSTKYQACLTHTALPCYNNRQHHLSAQYKIFKE